jgi:hypothetical protein
MSKAFSPLCLLARHAIKETLDRRITLGRSDIVAGGVVPSVPRAHSWAECGRQLADDDDLQREGAIRPARMHDDGAVIAAMSPMLIQLNPANHGSDKSIS